MLDLNDQYDPDELAYQMAIPPSAHRVVLLQDGIRAYALQDNRLCFAFGLWDTTTELYSVDLLVVPMFEAIYTDSTSVGIYGSNYSDKVGQWSSNYTDLQVKYTSNYSDKVGVWGSNYTDLVGNILLIMSIRWVYG